MQPTPDSPTLSDFLETTSVVDWTDPLVTGAASTIVGDASGDTAQCRLLFEWVRDEIPHSHDIDSDVVTCTASDVLAGRTGICHAKSHLLAGLCRARGIPTGFCYQVSLLEPPHPKTVLHGFTAHYLRDVGRWVRLDARGNTGDIHAEFSTGEERLAFPLNPAAGELYIYDTIFHRPAVDVVSVLRAFTSRRAMWEHLPAVVPTDTLRTDRDRAFNASLETERS